MGSPDRSIVDLTSLQPGAGTETLRVRNTFGPITVTLPADLGYKIHIDARTSFGPVALPAAVREKVGRRLHSQDADLGSGPQPSIST